MQTCLDSDETRNFFWFFRLNFKFRFYLIRWSCWRSMCHLLAVIHLKVKKHQLILWKHPSNRKEMLLIATSHLGTQARMNHTMSIQNGSPYHLWANHKFSLEDVYFGSLKSYQQGHRSREETGRVPTGQALFCPPMFLNIKIL